MQDFVTCKNEDDSIFKKKESLELSQVYGDFFRRSRAATSTVLGPIWLNFELILYVVASSRNIYTFSQTLQPTKPPNYNIIFYVIVFLVRLILELVTHGYSVAHSNFVYQPILLRLSF